MHSQVDWDHRYAKGWAYGKAPSDFLEEAVQRFLGVVFRDGTDGGSKRILSLGEGQGRNITFLAQRFGAQCTAVDISSVAAKSTKRLAAQRGVSHLVDTVTMDLASYEPEKMSYDVIIFVFCTFSRELQADIHRRCLRALRPNGVVIIECFSPRQSDINAARGTHMGPPSCCLVSWQQLVEDFQSLHIMLAQEEETFLREGSFHRGLASCTQFVARAPRETHQYKASVDIVFNEVSRDGDSIKQRETHEDILLSHAPELLQTSCRVSTASRWCRYCWCPPNYCFCEMIPSVMWAPSAHPSVHTAPGGYLGCAHIHWVFVVHPNEFLRSTSSAKLAAQALPMFTRSTEKTPISCSSEFLVYGCNSHDNRLNDILNYGDKGNTAILFPEQVDVDAGADGGVESTPLCVRSVNSFVNSQHNGLRELTVIVPDGSWANASQLVKAMQSVERISLVALDAVSVSDHHSPLIEALKAGQGQGRISTLEACVLFLKEAMASEYAEMLMTQLNPLVKYISDFFHPHIQPSSCTTKIDDALVEAWTLALQYTAENLGTLGLPEALRRCVLCSENLATPSRMLQHLKGKKHCSAVARRYLETSDSLESVHGIPSDPKPQTSLIVWETHSTSVMAAFLPEPPDIALERLKQELKKSTKMTNGADESSFPSVDEESRSKGERILAVAAKPVVSAELPIQLTSLHTLKFDNSIYDLYSRVQRLLQSNEVLGKFRGKDKDRLEEFEPAANIFRSVKHRQVLYNIVCNDEELLGLYERMVVEVVCPYLKKQMELSSSIEDLVPVPTFSAPSGRKNCGVWPSA